MAQGRKDSKGRVLNRGEYQKKSGVYEYRYTDARGKNCSVYSWKLTDKDRTPNGKKEELSLRELEAQIARDKMNGVVSTSVRKITLDDYFYENIESRHLAQSTRTNYKYSYRNFIQKELGSRKLVDIKYSDIQKFYNYLMDERKLKPNSVEVVNTILHPIFETAVRDDIINKNPMNGVMAELKKRRDWVKPKRDCLTSEQQEAFMDYLDSSAKYNHWKTIFTVFLGTGGRSAEILGLRWEDCNFKDGTISINHNLIYRQQDSGKCEFHITGTKTAAGVRTIPMLTAVKNVLTEEYKNQLRTGFCKTVIDGYSGFIFQNRFGNVYSPHLINQAIRRIVRDYNIEESERARAEHRDTVNLPHFSVHNLRHTFCSRLCENESDALTLAHIKEIMGHSDISTTLDVYTHLTERSKRNAMASLEDKIVL